MQVEWHDRRVEEHATIMFHMDSKADAFRLIESQGWRTCGSGPVLGRKDWCQVLVYRATKEDR